MNSPIEQMLDKIEWQQVVTPIEWVPGVVREGIPYATHVGMLDIDGIKLRCYQLSNGQRVFNADDVEELFSSEESNETT